MPLTREEALREITGGTFDGATVRYLDTLALASLTTGFFIARGQEPPAPARMLAELDAQDLAREHAARLLQPAYVVDADEADEVGRGRAAGAQRGQRQHRDRDDGAWRSGTSHAAAPAIAT